VSNYLIRVRLPDRPGALGAVASRIGSVGGDVFSIDILQRDNGVVVDELGVGLAGNHLVALLKDEILEVDGVSIESVRPVEGPFPDPLSELLDVATELFKQTSAAGLLEHLTVRVRRTLGADFAVVVRRHGGSVVAGDGEPPVEGPAAEGSGGEAGVAVAPLVNADLLLFVGREDPVLRDRERRWISAMAELADRGCRELT
jgi:hypothetical protein